MLTDDDLVHRLRDYGADTEGLPEVDVSSVVRVARRRQTRNRSLVVAGAAVVVCLGVGLALDVQRPGGTDRTASVRPDSSRPLAPLAPGCGSEVAVVAAGASSPTVVNLNGIVGRPTTVSGSLTMPQSVEVISGLLLAAKPGTVAGAGQLTALPDNAALLPANQIAQGSNVGSAAVQGSQLTVSFVPPLVGSYPVYYDIHYRLPASSTCADNGRVREAMGQLALVNAG